MSTPGGNVLYNDSGVTLTDTQITIKKYYFPLATAKKIDYSRIWKVLIIDRFCGRIWGSGDFVRWYNCDGSRLGRRTVIELHIDSSIIPCITPDDTAVVYRLLQNRAPKTCEFVDQRRGRKPSASASGPSKPVKKVEDTFPSIDDDEKPAPRDTEVTASVADSSKPDPVGSDIPPASISHESSDPVSTTTTTTALYVSASDESAVVPSSTKTLQDESVDQNEL